MKRCPKCSADYFDNMLEFCLEDGTRLTFAPQSATATIPTARHAAETSEGPGGPVIQRPSEETVVIPGREKKTDSKADSANISHSTEIVQIGSVALALAHNWWQWIYLEKVYISSITDFLLSANFLMWLLLLAAGTAAGVYSLKHSRSRTLAIISLVMLAINLILFLVPRR